MKGHTYSKRRPFTPLFSTRRTRNAIDACANRCNEIIAINAAFISASGRKVGVNSRALLRAIKSANRSYKKGSI